MEFIVTRIHTLKFKVPGKKNKVPLFMVQGRLYFSLRVLC